MLTPNDLEVAAALWDWQPHTEGQRAYMLSQAKNRVAACGRRWGKSEATAIDICLFALKEPNSIQFVIAPTDDQTKVIMEEVSLRLNAIPGLTREIKEVRSPYHSIAFLDATGYKRGTRIAGRTAGGKGIRGNKAHRTIEDEAAYIDDASSDNVIGPLRADYNADSIKISTPKGRNHFWRDFMIGQKGDDPLYESFRFPSVDNPFLSREFLDNEKSKKPDRVWREEYEAEFLEDAGGVFRGIDAVILPGFTPLNKPAPKGVCTIGIDLARVEDFTVLSVLDESGVQVGFERFNQISWERQVGSIIHMASLYPGAKIRLDSTGVGDPIFEALRKQLPGRRIEGYSLTNASKEALIDNLAMLIETGKVSLMDIPEQTSELRTYQYEITPQRNVRMNAPSGMHDDTVIALALAAWDLRPKQKQEWNLL